MNKKHPDIIRKARVFKNGTIVGYLLAYKKYFVFLYDKDYIKNGGTSIAISLPKNIKSFHSKYMFPFFSGLLPEGKNKTNISQSLLLNPNNKFAMLLELAQKETIGNITIQECKE
jgi:serine/threonine-protein kinase HipA